MKIGALSLRVGMSASQIRFYEKHGLIAQPERSSNGYRAYKEDAVQRLQTIKLCTEIGMSLDEIKEFLPPDPLDFLSCEHVLQALKKREKSLKAHIHKVQVERKKVSELIQYFESEQLQDEHADLELLLSRIGIIS